jgi:hypothetical protein
MHNDNIKCTIDLAQFSISFMLAYIAVKAINTLSIKKALRLNVITCKYKLVIYVYEFTKVFKILHDHWPTYVSYFFISVFVCRKNSTLNMETECSLKFNQIDLLRFYTSRYSILEISDIFRLMSSHLQGDKYKGMFV